MIFNKSHTWSPDVSNWSILNVIRVLACGSTFMNMIHSKHITDMQYLREKNRAKPNIRDKEVQHDKNFSTRVPLEFALLWRHNGRDGVSNHQPHDCLLSILFRHRSENVKAPRHWPLCGELTGERWIPAQMASNAENVSIWWRHHDTNGPLTSNEQFLGMATLSALLALCEENSTVTSGLPS